jgi:hypothetical protein
VQQLPSRKRLHLRSLRLLEGSSAVSQSAKYATGLIPFCIENPRLRIERHIALFDNVLPLESVFLDQGAEHHSRGYSNILAHEIILAMWIGIDEVLQLTSRGMPANSFKLVVNGSSPTMQEALAILKTAALYQEAMSKWAVYHGKDPQPPITQDPQRLFDSLPLPLYLPQTFGMTIRDIVSGVSPMIELSVADGMLWDAQAMFETHRDWTEADWRKEWHKKVLCSGFRTPFYRELRSRYRLDDPN